MALKSVIIIFVLITQSISYAYTLRVFDQNKKTILTISEQFDTPAKNVYQVTQTALDQATIPYQSSEQGFYSINNISPTTNFISDTEFKTYGWCFTVNKVLVETQAIETNINDTDEIEWFYGYAHYRNGQWLGMCELDVQ